MHEKHLLIIITLIEVVDVDLTFDSKCFISADLGDLSIVPSTWLSDNGTGVRGCRKISAISFPRITSEHCQIYLFPYELQQLCYPCLISFFFHIQFEICKVWNNWFIPRNTLALSYILHKVLSHLTTALIDW